MDLPPAKPSTDDYIGEQPGVPNAGETWHPLYLFNLYRLFLSGTASLLVLSDSLPFPLGSFNTKLFAVVSILYFLTSSVAAFAIRARRRAFMLQLHFQVFSDIAFITLLMFASGGIGSGVGILLVVTVAGGALLVEGRTASLFAAMATIAVLSEELYTTLNLPFQKSILIQAGIYGIVFFITAIVAHRLAGRLRQSQALARRRGVDLANLAQTNAYIIRHIQAGILVLDRHDRIHLANAAAWQLLGQPDSLGQRRMSEFSVALGDAHERWLRSGSDGGEPLPLGQREVLPRFTRLGSASDAATLVFLEDTTQLNEQAQQSRLAGLGRLTANIAHEIRNPLGAINQAAQLLDEGELDCDEIPRLVQIILAQSKRVNTVVENVLTLSRRTTSHPRVVEIKPELERCSRECLNSIPGLAESVVIDVSPADLRVYVDASQLSQVLWNLCANAVHQFQLNGEQDGEPLELRLEARLDPHSPAVLMDVVDNGPGVPTEMQDKIFEPFFTSHENGTGLGLYMSRELCESNRSELFLVPHDGPGARFRIRIPDRSFLFALGNNTEESPA